MVTSRTIAGTAVLLAGVLVVAEPGRARADEPFESCGGAVGTYLTTNVTTVGGRSEVVGRSLISLTNGGHAFLTDSNEAGGSEFAPFTDGRGSWRCERVEDGREHLKAIILDFTLTDRTLRQQQIARLDYDAVYNAASDTLAAEVRLAFAPFYADPLDEKSLEDSTTYSLVGVRVEPQ
jgi:hypothetical protein